MSHRNLVPEPTSRKLRIFALDPSVAIQFDMAGNDIIEVDVRWERDLKAGPVGEYLEIVDADPASGMFYKPVNLNDPWVLAQRGLAPSDTNPQFHQQMVYAVAMTTISHFERALGRDALWSAHRVQEEAEYVQRLRIYPHALRDRNAYYSPEKKALLFGYFPAAFRDANTRPDTMIFTCLSHDIIAHETTHALLDGVHPRFNEAVNIDVLAFHEAFADIVALFQHFSYPGLLRSQIATTRGDLASENLLGQLAQQFGRASGRGRALRDVLGGYDAEGQWQPHKPNIRALDNTLEPHARGAILVAAVFGAFLKMYRVRTRDLFRLASEGTGVLKQGELPTDLTGRLAEEASRCAQSVLQMCIRAIDCCPPVNITFGDYLRAVVTADHDLNGEETAAYRLAFVDSFGQWGIHPKGMRSIAVESLLWPDLEAAQEEAAMKVDAAEIASLWTDEQTLDPAELESLFVDEQPQDVAAQRVGSRSKQKLQSKGGAKLSQWVLGRDRREAWEGMEDDAATLWAWLMQGKGRKLLPILGIVAEGDKVPKTVFKRNRRIAVEVPSVRRALRRNPKGETVADLIVEVTQRRRGYYDADVQRKKDSGELPIDSSDFGDFRYRAGCTLVFDAKTMTVRRVIRTAGRIDDDVELESFRSFLMNGMTNPDAFHFARAAVDGNEPFAMLHRRAEDK